MPQQELLTRVVQVLDESGIDYMVTGSVVSGIQGEPRATHDVDLVVALSTNHVDSLVAAFSSDEYYLSRVSVEDAIRNGSMFNLLAVDEGDKVDFWILTDEPFDQSRFGRKYSDDVFGHTLKLSSPEDTILAKLRWDKMYGGSEKQFTDALRVYEVQHKTLDTDYIDRWAAELGVEERWRQLQQSADVI